MVLLRLDFSVSLNPLPIFPTVDYKTYYFPLTSQPRATLESSTSVPPTLLYSVTRSVSGTLRVGNFRRSFDERKEVSGRPVPFQS